MDMTLLERLAKEAGETPILRIALWQNGEVAEREVHPSNECNALYSVTKNFIATACGICIDEGMLRYDTTVWELFAEEKPWMDPLWKQVTLERVLSQTVGVDGMFLDSDTEDVFSWPDKDWLDIVLEHPFTYTPGEQFAYSDSNYYLASRMVGKACGRFVQELLAERVFLPMKMQGWAWAVCPAGHATGGGGLYLRVRDMAKLGALYMNGGVYEGKRILSEEFVSRAICPVSHPDDETDYGLSFWIPKNHPHGVYLGSGYYDQGIAVDPVEKRVLAWHSVNPTGEKRMSDLLKKMGLQ